MRYGWRLVVLSFTLLTSQALISQEINAASLKNEECCRSTKKILNKYKEHLENTTWIVPPDTLLAYSYIAGMNIPVVDQTVWVINKFDNGYFFGNAYLSLNGTPSSQLNLVGSITSLGDVYIGFYPLPGSSSNAIVATGIGKFKKQNGQYQFIMQMNSPINNSVGLSHWSYMISVDKNDEFYWHLPGENISVPEFISQF